MKRGTRKTMSVAQLAANRRNAKRSTGPTSAAGKEVSKLNAMKHGVLARTTVVRGERFAESSREFKRLCQEFYASLKPEGPLETMLVDQIIQASWRLRRARLAESGEVALSVDGGHRSRASVHPTQQWALWRAWGDPLPSMRESKTGNSLLELWLREVRAAVERDGELTEAARSIPFQGEPNRMSEQLKEWRQAAQPPGGATTPAAREEAKATLLAEIDRELRMLRWRIDGYEREERREEASRQTAAVLPSAQTLDKIMRYEAALERQLYKAMAELERLQRRRGGETVPAPVSLEVSTRMGA